MNLTKSQKQVLVRLTHLPGNNIVRIKEDSVLYSHDGHCTFSVVMMATWEVQGEKCQTCAHEYYIGFDRGHVEFHWRNDRFLRALFTENDHPHRPRQVTTIAKAMEVLSQGFSVAA